MACRRDSDAETIDLVDDAGTATEGHGTSGGEEVPVDTGGTVSEGPASSDESSTRSEGGSEDGAPPFEWMEPAVGTSVEQRTWEASDGGNGHHYMLVSVPEGLIWSDARAAAEASGGYLVTITSEAENTFVYELTHELPWPIDSFGNALSTPLGGTIADGLWTWVTGEAWSFTSWSPGEPNNWAGSPAAEDIALMWGPGGTPTPNWNDGTDVGFLFMYVVEYGDVVDPADVDVVIEGCSIVIELTPADVGSTTGSEFDVLPTDDPSRFGLDGAEVRSVDFDLDPLDNPIVAGTMLTTQYSALGVSMSGLTADDAGSSGPASGPNVARLDTPAILTFGVPVVAVGLVNTSPERDVLELWSGPNRTGTLLARFRDQYPGTVDNQVHRFVGGRTCDGQVIGSMAVYSTAGDLELDELVFEVVP